MIKNKIFLLFITSLLFVGGGRINAQTPNVAIALNEYCVGNFSIADDYGYNSDWLEIKNVHTASVSLNGYYLSNDRLNLYKWKFPSTFGLASGQIGVVYLSGRNITNFKGGTYYYHTNFNIDQCKNQWLILTTPQGVIRDSVFVQKTIAGHTRGRVDYSGKGIDYWGVYTIHSFALENPNVGYFKGYLPTPTFTPQAGWGHNGETLDMFIGTGTTIPYNSEDPDNCYEIHYTTDGSIPTLLSPIYTSTNPPIIITDNQIYRAATFPKTAATTNPGSPFCLGDNVNYLPGFVQTNTYFSESNGSFDAFDSRFGVMSIALNTPDANWLQSVGANPGPIAHVEYFENKQQKTEGYAQLYRPINESWLTAQRGFYVTIDDRRGFGCNFEGPIFSDAGLGASSRTLFPTLHVKSGDIESNSRRNVDAVGTTTTYGTGIRDVFYQSLAAKYNLKVNPLHIKPLITFINGQYMGVYDLREVYDKYYEAYYNKQPQDSVILQSFHQIDAFVQNQLDGRYSDPLSINLPSNKFKTDVWDWVYSHTMNSPSFYGTLMSRLDKESFIDYMILNSYGMNSDLWNYNVAFGKGTNNSQPGSKWHYYLWNTPTIFNFTAVATNTLVYQGSNLSPCAEYIGQSYTSTVGISPYGGNTHGRILKKLMDPIVGNPNFKLEYKNRYQDLLNGALKCENILAHYDYVVSLFRKEMLYHESLTSTPAGAFISDDGMWETNLTGSNTVNANTLTTSFRQSLEKRCDYVANIAFSSIPSCYGMYGPFPISVDVYPPGSGSVKLNTVVLPRYIWDGKYFQTQLSFKAIPTSTSYAFHHWEFKTHVTKNNAPLSLDSVAIDFNQTEQVKAIFTDVTADVDIPTGFSPNGDGNNDEFKPLGSALYTHDYDFRIWNRWGQEVFRSTDPSVGWDGYFEGKQAQTGVYAYVITYKNVYNEQKIKKGNVTLVR